MLLFQTVQLLLLLSFHARTHAHPAAETEGVYVTELWSLGCLWTYESEDVGEEAELVCVVSAGESR